MVSNTTQISKVSVGNYFGGNVDGFEVKTVVEYHGEPKLPNFVTRVRNADGDLLLIESHTTVKTHKVMARKMLADINGYLA